MDINDNSHVLKIKDDDKTYIRENNPCVLMLTKVTAQNRDTIENGYALYSMSNISPEPFGIDHFVRVVTTTKVLDYKTMKCDGICM